MPYADPAKEAAYAAAWRRNNREKIRIAQARWRAKNVEKSRVQAKAYYWALDPAERLRKDMLQHARRRAAKRGVPCTISLEDVVVPDLCPIREVPMRRARGSVGPNSPSIDCVVPSKGYVPGNVRVISHAANRLKSNATLEQLKALVRYVEEAISGD